MNQMPMTNRRLFGLMGLALLFAVVAAVAMIGGLFAVLILAPGPSAGEYEAVADDLDLPPDWELAGTTIKAPGALDGCIRLMDQTCPSVTRFYYAGGQAIDVYRKAKDMLVAAGFQVEQEYGPACDLPPSGEACGFFATSARAIIDIGVHKPGSGTGGDGVVTPDPNRAMVRLIVRGPDSYPPGRRTSPSAVPRP